MDALHTVLREEWNSDGLTKMADEQAGRWWEEEGGKDFNFAAAGGEGDDEGDDDYETSGSHWIGKSTVRCFGRNAWSWGTVVAWLPPEKNDGVAFYRVRHDDGDEEDLDDGEVREYAGAYAANPRPENAAVAQKTTGKAAPDLGDSASAPEPPADLR